MQPHQQCSRSGDLAVQQHSSGRSSMEVAAVTVVVVAGAGAVRNRYDDNKLVGGTACRLAALADPTGLHLRLSGWVSLTCSPMGFPTSLPRRLTSPALARPAPTSLVLPCAACLPALPTCAPAYCKRRGILDSDAPSLSRDSELC